ncbi:MAG: hypothetical protein ACOYT8_05785 [Candidatus Dependentiae bacterium]
MKKLLILMLFLNSPIFGMDVWTKIKRWVTENPSGAPAVETTPLPVLPSDVQTTEIVKQLLNVSSNRDQALTLLSNYAQVNKAIGNYVKNNKATIQRLLDEKFGLSLIELASGNYDNPQIKDESISILKQAALTPSYEKWAGYLLNFAGYITTGQRNPAITPYAELDMLKRWLGFNYPDKFKVVAVMLGVLNNTFNNNRAAFGEAEENTIIDILKDYIGSMGQDKNYTQIVKLIINTAVKIFGPQFINKEKGFYFPQTGTLLESVRKSTNKEAIKYLETINKLNR